MSHDTLVFIPTYNERENVERLFEGIKALKRPLDVLFVDDHSPDGTGQVLDALTKNNPNLAVLHRSGKLGIGSAHQEGIRWAYQHKYKMLITMDCDFTHPPEYIVELLKNSDGADVVVGSRYMLKDSLKGWNLYRIVLTKMGHLFTNFFLGLKYDATGALRLYKLDVIPPYAFDLVASRGYSFFYESLFILNFNKFRIREIPIKLPVRTYGHSKMRMYDAWQSLKFLMIIFARKIFDRTRFEISEPFIPDRRLAPALINDQEWEQYWASQKSFGHLVYDAIAVFYRKCLIKPALNHFIRKYFRSGAQLLHAGCGSGQVDLDIRNEFSIIAMDYSINALSFYKKTNKDKCRLLYGSMFEIPLPDHSLDGVYNLGVMEHYTAEENVKALQEFKRVVKPSGKVVMFWPPEFGLSIMFMKAVHFLLQKVLKKNIKMHPDEICRVRSRDHVADIVRRAGFELVEYSFGPRDAFTYCIVVIAPRDEARKEGL